MIDTDKCEGHTCKWCGYVEDTHAWHYEECPIFDDPMMKHHIAELKRLRNGIRSILSDYDITELIRDVPEDEWNFEQQALVRIKEMIG